MTVKFDWNGEKVKQVIAEEKDLSPKDILNGLDSIRGQIQQNESTIKQLEQQMKIAKANVKKAQEDEKIIGDLEPKCIEIQKEHILKIIHKIHDASYEKAKLSSAETIAKAPDAYTEEGKKNLPYLDYQKLLGTDPKMAEKISKRMITKFLYEEPIFDNPFKD